MLVMMKKQRKDYVRVYSKGKIVKEHTKIVEEILGKPLPKEAVIHHIDNNPRNNKTNNLIIFQNQKEHLSFHQREKAYDVCGNANWRKCRYCKTYDDIQYLKITISHGCTSYYHPAKEGRCKK
jgi:hypothetical protein